MQENNGKRGEEVRLQFGPINLVDVHPRVSSHVDFLYDLLSERDAFQNISHEIMPTYQEHKKFIEKKPYRAWYIIYSYETTSKETLLVGSIYLTNMQNTNSSEVGIFISKKFHGYGLGEKAIKLAMEKHFDIKVLYANINPNNHKSIKFFTDKFNAVHIQNTYKFINEYKK